MTKDPTPEKLSAYEKKAKAASKLFREIRSGRYRLRAYRSTRFKVVTLQGLAKALGDE